MDAVIIAHNLPVQPTQFVGRRREIDEAVQLLSDPACRLLTLVGPGGIGKTRLSVEIGQRLQAEAAPDYPDGVFFIPLQALEAPELMVTSIADEAGFQFFQGAKPREQLLDYLSNKRLLLLLDNMEHLLAGVGFLSELLSCAPGVKLLVTSREA
ncbi:MAG: AAA family ATPase, partial [Anaerolineae bacterium]|nr:AAA family ATPase [Anaerolineae bacterium]